MSNKKFLKNLLATATVFGVVATGSMEASASIKQNTTGAADLNAPANLSGILANPGILQVNAGHTLAANKAGQTLKAVITNGIPGLMTVTQNTTVGAVIGTNPLNVAFGGGGNLTLDGAASSPVETGGAAIAANSYDKLDNVDFANKAQVLKINLAAGSSLASPVAFASNFTSSTGSNGTIAVDNTSFVQFNGTFDAAVGQQVNELTIATGSGVIMNEDLNLAVDAKLTGTAVLYMKDGKNLGAAVDRNGAPGSTELRFLGDSIVTKAIGGGGSLDLVTIDGAVGKVVTTNEDITSTKINFTKGGKLQATLAKTFVGNITTAGKGSGAGIIEASGVLLTIDTHAVAGNSIGSKDNHLEALNMKGVGAGLKIITADGQGVYATITGTGDLELNGAGAVILADQVGVSGTNIGHIDVTNAGNGRTVTALNNVYATDLAFGHNDDRLVLGTNAATSTFTGNLIANGAGRGTLALAPGSAGATVNATKLGDTAGSALKGIDFTGSAAKAVVTVNAAANAVLGINATTLTFDPANAGTLALTGGGLHTLQLAGTANAKNGTITSDASGNDFTINGVVGATGDGNRLAQVSATSLVLTGGNAFIDKATAKTLTVGDAGAARTYEIVADGVTKVIVSNTTHAAGVTFDKGSNLGALNEFNFTADKLAIFGDGVNLTSTTGVTTSGPGSGTVQFNGDSTVTGVLGSNNTMKGAIIAGANKTVTFNNDLNLAATGLSFVADGVAVVKGNIKGAAGIDSSVVALAGAGTVTFANTADITVDGDIGATNPIKQVNLGSGKVTVSAAANAAIKNIAFTDATSGTLVLKGGFAQLGGVVVTTKTKGVGIISINENFTTAGARIGVTGTGIQAVNLDADKTLSVSIGDSIFADLTTSSPSKGTVDFLGNFAGAVAGQNIGNVGTATNPFKSVTFVGGQQVSGDLFADGFNLHSAGSTIQVKNVTMTQGQKGSFALVGAADTLSVRDGGSINGDTKTPSSAVTGAGVVTFEGAGTVNGALGVAAVAGGAAAAPLAAVNFNGATADKIVVVNAPTIDATAISHKAATVQFAQNTVVTVGAGKYVAAGSTINVQGSAVKVAGAFDMSGANVFESTLKADGTSGSLNVAGAVTPAANTTASVVADLDSSIIPEAGTTWTVLTFDTPTYNALVAADANFGKTITVTNGVNTNRFTSFTGLFDAANATSDKTKAGVKLVLTGGNDASVLKGISIASKGATANSSKLAAMLADGVTAKTVTGNAKAYYTDLGRMNDANVVESENRITSRELAGTAANETLSATNNALAARLASTGAVALSDAGNGVAAGDSDAEMGAWVSGFAGRATQKARKGDAGYKANTQGGVVGFDTALNDATTVGVAAVMSQTNTKYKNNKSGDKNKATTYMFAVYGSRDFGNNWMGEASAMFGNSSVKNNAKLLTSGGYETATGKFDAMSYSMKALAGYNYKASDSFTITPMVGLAYTRINEGGYKETGTTNQNRSVSKKAVDRIEGILGARVATVTDMGGLAVTPEAHVFMNYNFKNKAPKVDVRLDGLNGALPTSMAKPAALSTNVGLSLTAKSGMMEYGAGADMQFANKYSAYQGALKVRVNF